MQATSSCSYIDNVVSRVVLPVCGGGGGVLVGAGSAGGFDWAVMVVVVEG